MEIYAPISPRRSVGPMPMLGRFLRSALAQVLAVAALLTMSACGDNRSYRALPVSAERDGVVVRVYEAPRGKEDFSYTVRNASSECVHMSAVRLPQGNALFLDGLVELVDESGRKLERGFMPNPGDSLKDVFFRLQPNEELTRTVNVREIFGVPHLEGYTAALTISVVPCDPAKVPPPQPQPLLTLREPPPAGFSELDAQEQAEWLGGALVDETGARPYASPEAAQPGDITVRGIRFVPRN